MDVFNLKLSFNWILFVSRSNKSYRDGVVGPSIGYFAKAKQSPAGLQMLLTVQCLWYKYEGVNMLMFFTFYIQTNVMPSFSIITG